MKKAMLKREQWGIPGDIGNSLWMYIVDRDDTRPLVNKDYPHVCKIKTNTAEKAIISGWHREADQNRKPDYEGSNR